VGDHEPPQIPRRDRRVEPMTTLRAILGRRPGRRRALGAGPGRAVVAAGGVARRSV